MIFFNSGYIFDFCSFRITSTVALKGHSRFFIDITIRAPINTNQPYNDDETHIGTNTRTHRHKHIQLYEDMQQILDAYILSN